jgi:hypothetical protein
MCLKNVSVTLSKCCYYSMLVHDVTWQGPFNRLSRLLWQQGRPVAAIMAGPQYYQAQCCAHYQERMAENLVSSRP